MSVILKPAKVKIRKSDGQYSAVGNAMNKVFGENINGQGATKFNDVNLNDQLNCHWYGVVHNLSDAPDTLS